MLKREIERGKAELEKCEWWLGMGGGGGIQKNEEKNIESPESNLCQALMSFPFSLSQIYNRFGFLIGFIFGVFKKSF